MSSGDTHSGCPAIEKRSPALESRSCWPVKKRHPLQNPRSCWPVEQKKLAGWAKQSVSTYSLAMNCCNCVVSFRICMFVLSDFYAECLPVELEIEPLFSRVSQRVRWGQGACAAAPLRQVVAMSTPGCGGRPMGLSCRGRVSEATASCVVAGCPPPTPWRSSARRRSSWTAASAVQAPC
jgi:hypothetical protein